MIKKINSGGGKMQIMNDFVLVIPCKMVILHLDCTMQSARVE